MKLEAFAELTSQDRWLLIQACLALIAAKSDCAVIASKASEVGYIAEQTRVCSRSTRCAIETATRSMPGATCLSPALVLQRLLSMNGHASELRIGVEKSDDGLRVHAWLTQGNRILIGGSQIEELEVLASSPAEPAFNNRGLG